MNVTKPVILITGTSSGFGCEAVMQYAAAGYQVIATMRNTAKADPAFATLENVDVEQLDVTDTASIYATIKTVMDRYGKIDVLFNNAGYNEAGAFEEVSDDAARREMETNFWGPVNMIRAVLPIMREQKHGHILNTSSMAAYLNLPTMAFYSASKAAVTSLSETLNKEVKSFGIHITNIEPGGFNTSFGVNSQTPKESMPFYQPVYESNAKFAARVFIEAGLGDLSKAVALIVKETLADDAPLHLIVGMQGYYDARNYLTNLIDSYDQNADLTKTTDPDPEDVNIFKYIFDRAASDKKDEMRNQLINVVFKFQANGQLDETDMTALIQLVTPEQQTQVKARVAAAIKEYN